MKSQVYMSDRAGAQHAIDQIKKAYATGQPHMIIIQEPTAQASSKQKKMAMTLVSLIARETGEEDVDRMKDQLLNEMGWFAELVEEKKPMRVSLSHLSKDDVSFFIERLLQLCAEQGIKAA